MSPSPPLCRCNKICLLRTVSKGENEGKKYYSCPLNFGDPNRCKYFGWAEAVGQQSSTNGSTPQTSPIAKMTHGVGINSSPSFRKVSTFSPATPSSTPGASSTSRFGQKVLTIMCPKHNVSCIRRQTMKDGPNKNRFYFTCPVERGCFFKWEDEIGPDSPFMNKGPLHSVQHFVDFQLCCKSQKNNADDSILGGNTSSNADDMMTAMLLIKFPQNQLVCDECTETLRKNNIPLEPAKDRSKFEWYIPENVYHKAMKLLSSIEKLPIKVRPIPSKVNTIIKSFMPIDVNDDSLVDWNRIPDKLTSSLRPFQKQGVNFGIQREGKVLLADEMGLGKTLQSLCIAYYYKDEWPLLIICPSLLRLNWSKEIEEWLLPEVKLWDINIIMTGKDHLDGRVNIISYDLALRMIDEINKKEFKVVIADECHYLKNIKAQRTSAIIPVLHQAKRAIMLTGTPALSRPSELYTQLSALLGHRDTWFTKNEFAFRYCNAQDTAFGIDDKGSSNLLELHYLLAKTIMLRRLKDNVLKELPPKWRQQVYISVKNSKVKQLKKSMANMKESVEKMLLADNMEEHGTFKFQKNKEFTQMFKITGLSKIEAAKEYLDNLIQNEIKFVIFAHHLEVLDGIEKIVRSNKVEYMRIDGSTPTHLRAERVKFFRDDERCRVAILSIMASGVGITLCGGNSSCTNVVFMELFYTPGALLQAEDRVHRIGQSKPVTVRYLLGKDTLDEKLWPMIKNKLEVIGQTLDGRHDDADSQEWQGAQLHLNNTIPMEDEWQDAEYDQERETEVDNNLEEDDEGLSPNNNNTSNLNQSGNVSNHSIKNSQDNRSERRMPVPKVKYERHKPKVKSNQVFEMFSFKKSGKSLPYNLIHDTRSNNNNDPTQNDLTPSQDHIPTEEEEDTEIKKKPEKITANQDKKDHDASSEEEMSLTKKTRNKKSNIMSPVTPKRRIVQSTPSITMINSQLANDLLSQNSNINNGPITTKTPTPNKKLMMIDSFKFDVSNSPRRRTTPLSQPSQSISQQSPQRHSYHHHHQQQQQHHHHHQQQPLQRRAVTKTTTPSPSSRTIFQTDRSTSLSNSQPLDFHHHHSLLKTSIVPPSGANLSIAPPVAPPRPSSALNVPSSSSSPSPLPPRKFTPKVIDKNEIVSTSNTDVEEPKLSQTEDLSQYGMSPMVDGDKEPGQTEEMMIQLTEFTPNQNTALKRKFCEMEEEEIDNKCDDIIDPSREIDEEQPFKKKRDRYDINLNDIFSQMAESDDMIDEQIPSKETIVDAESLKSACVKPNGNDSPKETQQFEPLDYDLNEIADLIE